MENKEKIIDKVRKLLALSTSPNEHEALLASTKASELLRKYNLTISAIEIEKEKARTIVRFIQKRLPIWAVALANILTEHFNCGWFCDPRIGNVSFVGVDNDLDVLVYTYMYLFRTCDKLGIQHVANHTSRNFMFRNDKMREKVTYCRGFVAGIDEQLKESKIVVNTKEVMVIKNQLVTDQLKEYHVITKPHRSSSSQSGSMTSYIMGKVAGKATSIRKAVR